MGIKHARHACQGSRYGKGQKLIFCNVDSHGLRRNPVVPDGHNRPARAGIYHVNHDKQGNQNQNNADQERGIVRRSRNSLGTVDENLPVRLHIHGKGVLKGYVKAPAVMSQENDVDDIFNNLSKGQGHDGKVISPQAENRDSYEKSEQSCRSRADENGQEEPQAADCDCFLGVIGEKCAGKGSHAHKTCMAQAQLS